MDSNFETRCKLHTKNFNTFIRKFFKSLKTWKIWREIYLAQILSLIICGTGATNSKLFDDYNVNIPTTQSIINYFLLAIIYTPIWFIYVNDKNQIMNLIKKNWWKYFLITFADVEANYLVIKAYSMTLLTTIQVIDAFIIPIALILSRIVLKTLYRRNHYIGVVGCLLGCALIIVGSTLTQTETGTHRLLGDFLCLASSVLYAISNVGQEYLVKEYSKLEYLSTTGMFGTIISIIQFFILEQSEIKTIDFSKWQIIYILLAINLLMFMLYSLFPHVVEMTSAAFININLLTADFYAVLIGIFAYGYKLHFLYFLGFFCIFFGTIFYCISEPLNKKQAVKVDILKANENIEESKESVMKNNLEEVAVL